MEAGRAINLLRWFELEVWKLFDLLMGEGGIEVARVAPPESTNTQAIESGPGSIQRTP